MSDMELTPMSVQELEELIRTWLEADTTDKAPGEYPAEVVDQYGEDPLAGVDHDTYLKALDELHEDGTLPDDAYEQAYAQIQAAGDDINPTVLALNITTVDNSIHTGDDFSGYIEQGDTTTTNQTGNEGIAAGGDVYDSDAITGDNANVASGDYSEAGDGDDIDASGSHITANEGSAIGFGSGSQSASNVDSHDWTDNSTYEDNDTDNSDNSYNDNSTQTDSFNSPYDSYNQDNDGEDIDDNDGYDEDYESNTHVDVDIKDGYDGYEHKAEEYAPKAEEYVEDHHDYGHDEHEVD